MTRVRSRGEDIRKFILGQVEKHPSDISKLTAERFGITRQAVNKHLQKLTAEHALAENGKTRNRTYELAPILEWRKAYRITPDLAEDVVWTNDIRKTLDAFPDNVMNIWHHGFTEMFNNAIDHSGGLEIVVYLRKTATDSKIAITDDGVGIFKKIQTELNLLDERHALLELSKGKLTTDPKHHSGEGIFFTSRMFDSFEIISGGVYFSHEFGEPEDWLLERAVPGAGTAVLMKLHNHTARTAKKIFDKYTSGDNFGFTKTVVPVKLAQYGNDKLISRSQAKRLLARIELFKTVVLNFEGVDSIGQAFADEIFRVFTMQHPEIELVVIRAKSEVKRMISRIRDGSGTATE